MTTQSRNFIATLILLALPLAAQKRGVTAEDYFALKNVTDARLSPELLETIFMRGSPLHDGAVIVKGGQILAAACLLPLSTNPNVSLALGTRHRAAIGITEESDAVVIVVSEETGAVSLAHDGELTRGLEVEQLVEVLSELPS